MLSLCNAHKVQGWMYTNCHRCVCVCFMCVCCVCMCGMFWCVYIRMYICTYMVVCTVLNAYMSRVLCIHKSV